MNSYQNEAIGDIIIIKYLNFKNKATGRQEPDHAWKCGRPCIIIYSDSEFDYFLSLTSVDKSNKKEYFKITDEGILYQEEFKYKYNRKDRKDKLIKGYINLETIYKMPISGHDRIGKVTFEAYKDIFNAMKSLYQNKDINEILDKAVFIRR